MTRSVSIEAKDLPSRGMEERMSAVAVHGPVSTEELFRRHATFVARLLFRLGVSMDDLDDVVQEVFLVVHRNGGYVPGPAQPTTYLASIAVRGASSHRRRRSAERARVGGAEPDDLPGKGNPVEALERSELAGLLERVLGQLDHDLRTVFVLVELEGESCIAVARALGIPVGTVYWRLHRARRRFRESAQVFEERVLTASEPSIEGCTP